MCDLTEKAGEGPFKGWKIVAEKEGKYYSVAMGFCYDDHEIIPVVRKQRCLAEYFSSIILTSGAFRPLMEGRSAIFESKERALELLPDDIYLNVVVEGFKMKVVPAIVKDSVYKGTYGFGTIVYAGKVLEFPGR